MTDFGMAKLHDSLNCEARSRLTLTMYPGTEVYMPPEATKDPPVYTAKIDCFSFGILVIQILTQKYPKPSNRQKEVRLNYPELPTGKVMINVPEIERRQAHINKIDPKHPLLSIALNCLNDEGDERPSAHQLCEQLEVLKRSSGYTESIPELFTRGKISMWQNTSEIQNIQWNNKDLTNKQRKFLEADKKQVKEIEQGGIDQRGEHANRPTNIDAERGIAELEKQPSPGENSNLQSKPKTSFRNEQNVAVKHEVIALNEAKHQELRKKKRNTDSIAQTVSLMKAASTQLEHGKDGIVQFSVYYDVAQSRLKVHLQHASNLPMVFSKGNPVHCDLIVMLHLDPDRETSLQSQIIESTNNPIFNETFQFGKMSLKYVRLQTLVLRFYNYAESNQVIEKAYAPLCNLDVSETVMQVKIIQEEEVEV